MLLYTMYLWLRKPRRGRLESDRRRACLLLLIFISLLLLHSGRFADPIDNAAVWSDAAVTRAPSAATLRVSYAVKGQ